MSAGESQNLPGPLAQAEAVYRDAAARLPVAGALIARRVRHFAARVRLGRDEPAAVRRLDEVTGGLGRAGSLSGLLPRVLDGALSLMGADFGTVQLLDPVTGSLRLVTQYGFDPGLVEYFAVVDDDHSACGQAARKGAQVVIADVNADPGFAPHRGIAAAAGFRAVQSTPLADEAGHLVGVVSTHLRRPGRPAGVDLRIMELYADAAGEAVAAHLGGAPGEDGVGDPVGRTGTSDLPGPGKVPVANVIALPGPGAGRASREPGLIREAASPEDPMADFAGYVVHRLFAVGLSLDSAYSIAGRGPAGDRVAAAAGEVDRLIREIRDYVFAGRTQGTRAGLPWNSRPDDQERAARTADRGARREDMARAARALQAGAAEYAARLERTAAITRPPHRMDYPAEIKRWLAFADQAEQTARRWEQSP